MSVDDNAGSMFLPVAQAPILVLVQMLEHEAEGGIAVAIGKDRSMQRERVALFEILRHAGFPVNEVIRLNTAAHKADDDQLAGRRGKSAG